MTPDSSSSLAMSVTIVWTLSLLVIMIGDGVIVAAQEYDFTSRGYDAVKPGLCPSPEEIDSQVLSSDCENDASCPGTKKCCKANTGAMLCQKAGSTTGCDVRNRVLQLGESVMVDCYNCTCLDGSVLMCPSYNCSGGEKCSIKCYQNLPSLFCTVDHQDASPTTRAGKCPAAVDPGECYAHRPCQQNTECNEGQKCCDVQCGVPVCIAELQVPEIGSGCMIGDKFYSSGERSNVSDAELDCHNCLCRTDGQWHCQRHLCTTKSRATAGSSKSAVALDWMLLLSLILSILYIFY